MTAGNLKIRFMKRTKRDYSGLVEVTRQEMLIVRGGVAVAFLDNFWDYVQKAVSFIKEYKKEIWSGLMKGWKNL